MIDEVASFSVKLTALIDQSTFFLDERFKGRHLFIKVLEMSVLKVAFKTFVYLCFKQNKNKIYLVILDQNKHIFLSIWIQFARNILKHLKDWNIILQVWDCVCSCNRSTNLDFTEKYIKVKSMLSKHLAPPHLQGVHCDMK